MSNNPHLEEFMPDIPDGYDELGEGEKNRIRLDRELIAEVEYDTTMRYGEVFFKHCANAREYGTKVDPNKKFSTWTRNIYARNKKRAWTKRTES